MRKARQLAPGFTLIELMIVITILAIVIAIGVPSFTQMIRKNRLAAATNDLAGALQYARAEAVRRGRSVQVEAKSGDLANGLRIWFDDNGNGSYDDGETLRELAAPATSIDLSAEKDGSAATNLSFSYTAQGAVSGGGNELKISICDDVDDGRQLKLLSSGVLRLKSDLTCSGA